MSDVTFVIFRDYDSDVIALFPELPISMRPKECLGYSDKSGFIAFNYDHVMFHSRATNAKHYRDVLETIREQFEKLPERLSVNIIQRASDVMHDARKSAIAEGRLFSLCPQSPKK
jgi:hypothetical protein